MSTSIFCSIFSRNLKLLNKVKLKQCDTGINSHTEKWNRGDIPEINLHTHDQMIFDSSAKTVQWSKGQSFQQVVLGKLCIHM